MLSPRREVSALRGGRASGSPPSVRAAATASACRLPGAARGTARTGGAAQGCRRRFAARYGSGRKAAVGRRHVGDDQCSSGGLFLPF